jgi:hypothetical protein
MSKFVRATVIGVALQALAVAAGAQAPLVRCESVAGERQVCAAEAADGAQLARQLGGSSCVLGKTWGFGPRAIWVTENCRGEFRTVYETRDGEVSFLCDSDHGQLQRCAVDNRYGLVRVREEGDDDEKERCVLDETWGYGAGSVWVSKRCSTRFAMAPVALGRLVRCAAPEGTAAGERVECPLDTRGGVSVAALDEGAACDYGTSWGRTPTGIWVVPGCAASFLADGRVRGTATWSAPDRLVCGSPATESDFCPVDTTGGIAPSTEDLPGACIEDHTWGWKAQGIWVEGDCRGEFRLGR